MPVLTETARRHSGNARDLTVMVVEDDPMIMRLVTRMLEDEEGVEVIQGGKDVRALMNEPLWKDIDVAVVDLQLPGVSGDVLLRWLGANAPRVRRIVMSGWGPDRLHPEPISEVRLLKPFTLDQLLDAVLA